MTATSSGLAGTWINGADRVTGGRVARAASEGARVVTGGVVPDGPGAFYPPTLLANVDER